MHFAVAFQWKKLGHLKNEPLKNGSFREVFDLIASTAPPPSLSNLFRR
jgi:hypothetical protein